MPIHITFRPDDHLPPVVQSPKPKLALENQSESIVQPSKARKNNYNSTDKDKITEILSELDALIGLTKVKELVRELQAYVEIQRRRTREKLLAEPLVLHMIFRGNPGTGKTTVARLIGRLFKEMDVLQKGHIIECERADLVGEYIGHTAQKTREQVKKALGGVLFIDEAYSLARGGEKDFGKEAIDTLVKSMEDHKNEFILILAGYRNEMDWFLQTNPGLRSRFPIYIDFPDYSLDELLAIAETMLRERQYELSFETREAFRFMLQGILNTHPYAGNARLVRNMAEKAIRKQAVRLYQKPNSTREELMQILPIDLVADENKTRKSL
jgi:stage V sporulation protein K